MILPRSISHWPPKWAELFSERAAIMEFDGGLPRAGAELAAEKDIRELALREPEEDLGQYGLPMKCRK